MTDLPKYVILEDGHNFIILKRHFKDVYYRYLSCSTLVQAQHDVRALDAYE